MNLTLKGQDDAPSLYFTAERRKPFNAGMGTSLEITSCDEARIISVSGYKEALRSIDLSTEESIGSQVQSFGNGYVTITLTGSSYISSFELNDDLNGQNWKLNGYSVTHKDEQIWRHEIWIKPNKNKKN